MTQRQFAKEFGDLVKKYKESRKNKRYNAIQALAYLDSDVLGHSYLHFSNSWRICSIKIKV